MKNKQIATLLAFTLGMFGVHRFYLQQKKLGWWYLAFFWTLIPLIIGWIDGIVFLFMSYAVFNRKYSLRHVFKKKYLDDEDIIDFNTDEKLEKELLNKLLELNDKDKVESFLKNSKEKGEYLPRKVYSKALMIISGKSNIYGERLDIQ
ncbi:TM2 domain-containing protein [Catalinimonas niigatensis]|uniref:TM2 domain-containing protein n=1 Tax=Catalinimonas niigatensis TaxID=1397264 RepID=UPI0026667CB7|nr:TM2 domain-containing protein [Catalinimonas niigatensis]WPP51324.1 TM2 domain-containing protein [Catalinimonas niigatensis]